MPPSTGNATHEQVMALLDFLQEHQDLARGHIRSQQAREHSTRLWREITAHLNSLGGAVKTVDQWKKVWADKKCLYKKAAVERVGGAKGTGGGPAFPQPTEQALKVLAIMGDGFGNAQTSAVINPFADENWPPSAASRQPTYTAPRQPSPTFNEVFEELEVEEISLAEPLLSSEDNLRTSAYLDHGFYATLQAPSDASIQTHQHAPGNAAGAATNIKIRTPLLDRTPPQPVARSDGAIPPHPRAVWNATAATPARAPSVAIHPSQPATPSIPTPRRAAGSAAAANTIDPARPAASGQPPAANPTQAHSTPARPTRRRSLRAQNNYGQRVMQQEEQKLVELRLLREAVSSLRDAVSSIDNTLIELLRLQQNNQR